ncbi:hypothetical protein BH09PSE6_BH09PSE6_11620 [soil metagenome]
MKVELWAGLVLSVLIIVACVCLFPPAAQASNGHVGLLMLALVVVAIMLGFPAAFTLMGMGVMFSIYAFGGNAAPALELVVQRAYAVMTNDVLISIPLFVFMGYLVERANLIQRLYGAMHVALARVPGALAVATLLTCALFATATGIIGAVVTVMGLLAMPTMLKAGYSVRLTSGVITAGGCLGVLIPPSILLIVYAATAGVSVVRLYAGAILPGLMLTGLYVLYSMIVAKLRPDLAPPLAADQRQLPLPAFATALAVRQRDPAFRVLASAFKGRSNAEVATSTLMRYGVIYLLPLIVIALVATASIRASDHAWVPALVAAVAIVGTYALMSIGRLELLRMLLGSFLPLAALIVAVLGSIVFGVATPTEATAVGAIGGLLLAAAYRQFNFRMLRNSVALTAKTSAMVCWLFVGSSIFAAAFALLGGQQIIEHWVLSLDLTPLQFMILAQLIIFLLGWPLDWAEIIVIFVPIFIPLLKHFGIDPMFFGLLVALNLQTAYLSPPVAMAAFYLRGVAPAGVTLNQIFLGMMPFMGLQIVGLVLLYSFPAIGLWLPSLLYD